MDNACKQSVLGLLGFALFGFTGCTVGPNYERPELADVPEFRFATTETLDTADVAWWSLFEDPALDALVSEALVNNYDVRIAASRVDEFAARIGVARSGAFPQISAGGNAGWNQISRETASGKLGGQRTSSFYDASLSAGWELDVFGRIARATDAAVADTLASEEVRRGVILTLVSSVASSYIGIRSLDEQLAVSRQKLETRRESVELFELLFERGVVSRLELSQVQSEFERTATTIPAIERDLAILENALSVLLGRPPGDIIRGRSIHELTLPPVPAGLPSDLLQRRPDLREQEQRLIAANERVGVAVADFYPRFSLTGSLGLASEELSDLFTSSAVTGSLAGGVTAPLFTAGLLENQLEVAKAGERQLVDEYRLAVLGAIREAEDALVTRSTVISEAEAQSRQTQALGRYADLAQQRYDNGYVGYLEVLDAERDLFDAELNQVRLKASTFESIVGIYKAFGGGWVEIAESQTESIKE
ncbi:MAG: efflux transporter outer membrane subunit [Phycisphaerales bacterium]